MIGKIKTSKELLDIVLPSIEKSLRIRIQKMKKKRISFEKRVKESEVLRIQELTKKINEELMRIIKAFPDINELNDFYKELIDSMLSIHELKISWSKIVWTKNKIKQLSKHYLKKVSSAENVKDMMRIRKSFYGRVSSLLKELDNDFVFLEKARKEFKKLPSVKQIRTIVLAGYPNVGKTSLLKALTRSEPEINSYPFTTKEIKVGFVRKNKKRVLQVIDTPGILDRPLEKRNKIELKAILALRHLAEKILFLIDPTLSCGYSLEEQLNLYKSIKKIFKEKEIFLVINKSDLIKDKDSLKNALKPLKTYFISARKGELNDIKPLLDLD